MSLHQWGRYQGTLGGRPVYNNLGPYGFSASIIAAGTASFVWPAANLAIYQPIMLERDTAIARLWCYNGTTAAGNVDVGIYAADGTLLTSAGSTAQSGTSTLQVFDVTDLRIGPGLYYIAMVCSDATATAFGLSITSAQIGRVVGAFQEASAFALPAGATFAAYAQTTVPLVGWTAKSVG